MKETFTAITRYHITVFGTWKPLIYDRGKCGGAEREGEGAGFEICEWSHRRQRGISIGLATMIPIGLRTYFSSIFFTLFWSSSRTLLLLLLANQMKDKMLSISGCLRVHLKRKIKMQNPFISSPHELATGSPSACRVS